MHTPRPAAPPLALAGAPRAAAATACLLIGTPRTLAALAAQLALVPGAARVRPVGCVLVRDETAPPIDARGLPELPQVLGTLEELPAIHARVGVGLGVVTLPASMDSAARRARALLRSLGMSERVVPPLEELLSRPPAPARAGAAGTPGATQLDMVDLIGRTPYGVDRRAVARILTGKRVLITGAGGSIGSEIARIAATFRPELLVLMERSENALFEIDRQIALRHPEVARKAVLHDVADADATLRQLVALRPHAVFHAAAHKHVPLMEDHPSHAVTNNLFGTKSIADAALATGAERFVLISSDKAVNPTSVMGATKRLAEMYVQALQARHPASSPSATRMAMVRFGNVLGSACSVLPIWTNQIGEGGPVTVTDPRMTRYFMTIHEAAMLVIQAGALEASDDPARAGVYVLDMGEPVRILELASRFVAAHGFAPRLLDKRAPQQREDQQREAWPATLPEAAPESAPRGDDRPAMDIALVGARPGEKIHEELAYAAENLRPTGAPGINAWAGGLPATFDATSMVSELSLARHAPEREAVLAAIRRWVPEMRRADAAPASTPGSAPAPAAINVAPSTDTAHSAAA